MINARLFLLSGTIDIAGGIMGGKTFEETLKPVWDRTRKMGLTEKDIEALIEDARAKNGS
jgi:hypothetical protein